MPSPPTSVANDKVENPRKLEGVKAIFIFNICKHLKTLNQKSIHHLKNMIIKKYILYREVTIESFTKLHLTIQAFKKVDQPFNHFYSFISPFRP